MIVPCDAPLIVLSAIQQIIFQNLSVEVVSCTFMLRLSRISLTQFKNYNNQSFDFNERIIGICGKNGAGKTNLLDAVHYLCFTKSYFSRLDGPNIHHGHTGFRIEGKFTLNEKEEKAVCILRETGKKEFSVNDDAYEKFSQHIGRYPCVVIAPDDAILITGESRERRTFLDALLSQTSKHYLQQLIAYQKVLQQRNSLLKRAAETGTKYTALLDVLDKQLLAPGEYIFAARKKFLLTYLPMAIAFYKDISRGQEEISLFYESELLQSSFGELLKANRNRDFMLQRTCAGIHRDELSINMSGQLFKNIASQGQRKSLLFAMKLAEMEVLKKEKGYSPLLLLDDVFEKLDEGRVNNLLQKVCVENEGQVLITDTNEDRLRSHLGTIQVKYDLISL
jgi:DNA replication and repair protein RecF